jgi:hypothetical protein
MSQQDDPAGDQAHIPADTDRAARKPYQKPAFTREQLFETMALACGKANTTINQCRLIKKNS